MRRVLSLAVVVVVLLGSVTVAGTAPLAGVAAAAGNGATLSVTTVSTNGPVDAGGTLTVEATVENVGDDAGGTPVSLAVNGTNVDDETVSLAAGANETVTLSYDVPSGADTGSLVATVSTANDSAERTVSVDGNETLSGTLTDGATGDALPGVTVTVDDGERTRTVQTDASGTYSVTVLNASAVTVSATATVAGVEESVEINGSNATTVDGPTTLDLELYPELPGSGTEDDPYQIGNARELQAMSQDLSGHYVLVDDVNASGAADWNGGKGFDPVGTTDDLTDPDPATMFAGSLDGQDRSITGLSINRSNELAVGLFGAASDPTVSNVSLVDLDVTGASLDDVGDITATGGLVGVTAGLDASSIDASGSVSTGHLQGGLVGGWFDSNNPMSLELNNVSSTVDVTTDEITYSSGGVVGIWRGPATIKDSRATGDVVGIGASAGGFAGSLDRAELTNVSATGTVRPPDGKQVNRAGGLVGELEDGNVSRSAATGDVRTDGGNYAGGLIGDSDGMVSINESYTTGNVSGESYAGGLIGTDAVEISNSYATGTVESNNWAGGFVGSEAASISNSYATGSVNGSDVGGIAGELVSEMTNVYWNASTAANATTSGAATGATGLTPAQMTGANATKHMDGLDHETTWLAVEDEDTYPVLGWQVESYDLALADDEIDVGNTTEATVDVTLADGTQATATATSNYTTEGNVSVDDGTVTADTYGTDTVIASGGGLSDSASITALGSGFQVESVDGPADVNADETYSFEATVANVGNVEGTGNVTLSFDGTELTDESVTLAAGERRTITVEYTIPADADTGTVDLNATTPDDNATAAVAVNGYRTLSGTLTDGVSGEKLSGVDVLVDGVVVATTNASGYYEGQAHDNATVEAGATATVVGAEGDVEITATNGTTIVGNTTANLTLWAELDGDGTEQSPYEIGNAYELQAMSQDLSANYTLVSDVDASGTAAWNDGAGFDPIAGDNDVIFSGTFDGDDHAVEKLAIDRPGENNVGLFGTTNGTIHDVALANASVVGDNRVGGLVGINEGAITNATVSGSVRGTTPVGGLVGDLEAPVTNVSATANVNGSRAVGGLVGEQSTHGAIDRSWASGTVTGTSSDIGGLIGQSQGYPSVTNSWASGDVIGDGATGYVGGFGGNIEPVLSNVSATGDVTAPDADSVGGLVGAAAAGEITNTRASGNVTGDEEVGGLIGYAYETSRSYATGTVTGNASVGGAIGYISSYGSTTDVYWDVNATGRIASAGNATGLTTANMTGANATENMALDFETAWGPTTGYPHLRWNDARAEPVFAVTTVEPPATVAANRTLAANATVENVGAADGAKDVTLSFDGTPIATKSVTLAAGANETVSIEGLVPADTAPGEYEVLVTSPAGGAASATVEVKTLNTLSGTVTDGVSGDALDDETVVVEYASGRAKTVQTDATGSYTVEVFDGSEVTVSANVTADAIENPQINDSATFTVDGDETVSLELWPELDGEGTEANPYEISNAYELQAMNRDRSADYQLVEDVDASGTAEWNDGKGFDPVGDSLAASFTGTLDGDGHTITEMTIDRPAGSNVGLFGFMNGHVSNATIRDATVTGDESVGGLAGDLFGSVTNLSVSANVSGTENVGGIVGYHSGTVDASAVSGTVSGTEDVGGLGGNADSSATVTDSHAASTVSGAEEVGGLVGSLANAGTVENSYAIGDVSGDSQVGGLLGSAGSYSTVTDAYWDVDATNQSTSADDAIGLTTDQLTGVAPLQTMSGFDFETTWQLSTGYPQLRSQGLAPVGPLAIEHVEADGEVVEGRPLAVTVTVENVGDATSDGRVRLAAGGETVNRSAELALAPGENRTVTLEWTPEDVSSGTHALTVASAYDDDATTVQVVGIGSVEGTVTDDVTGEPIADATVTVGNGTYGPYDATTGADGSFALADVPAGDYEVTVDADGYHGETTADVAVHDGDATDLGTRTLTGNASISGTVDGALFDTPLGNATVTAANPGGTYTARTAVDGTYTIDGVPGTGDAYAIVADANGYEPNATAHTPVTVFEGAAVTGIDAALAGDATLDATVLDARAVGTHGIEDADLRLTRTADGASVTFEHATDANGTFSRAVPGTGADYELAVAADGYLSASEAVGTVGGGDSVGVDAELVGDATVAGTVTDDVTGEPVANATVTVGDGNGTYRAETDVDGAYAVTVPGTGSDYAVTAQPDAPFRTAGATNATVDSNRTVTADLALGRVSTYVAVDALGSPGTVEEDDRFTVTATVTNLGADGGNATVEYRRNGTVVDSATVSPDAGNATVVTFEDAIGEPGTYVLGVRTADETVSNSIDATRATGGGGSDDDGGSAGDDDGSASSGEPDDVATVAAEMDTDGHATATVSDGATGTVRVELGDLVRDDASGTAITRVDLSLDRGGSDVTFTADSLSERPAGTSGFRPEGGASASEALAYFELTATGEDGDDSQRLDSATVRFAVEADRLEGDELDRENVVLHRFDEDDGEWEALETAAVETTDGRVVYEATTPGFSVFAVGAGNGSADDPGGASTPDGGTILTESPTPTGTQPSSVGTTDADQRSTNTEGPGFGGAVTLLALLSVAFVVRRRA
ncbi:beta strand repeat-containing protein [Halorarum halobium]|uniref:beta strand repeat-containing protein n=1 Tax=Halorarum halobium TaxID=3075121 RepID=UPI0028A95B2A|nr:carboxypeptidase regulatory-like domain-containing protein [Halobaculum sp. XH14]